MMGKVCRYLVSLDLGLWLMVGVLLFMALGSFLSGGENGSSINDLPLFLWLREVPLAASWWLWGTIGLLALLAVNTVLCSMESLGKKWERGSSLVRIAPQVMHLGFLLIMVAHLVSARGSFKQAMEVGEGSTIGFPNGGVVQVGRIDSTIGPMGMPTAFSAQVRTLGGDGAFGSMSPNHPFFYRGFGIYLKEVGFMPAPVALVEIHREPGAGWALAGALLFTAGNVVLLAVRGGRLV
ncbi:cytochrome C biogenesis protein ResB [Geobacter sp. AOG1]|uniref:cytochrome C biogenesis protein ResB n=1 Tax=Geobacter sp. AOG1 TaxID=1566346 RepID=UPI001CC6431A|nr:cytochrome C biogenesis protein ResB [Geobacter sp. AOG1]GFE57015.1 cytochrome c biogenesis protein ResB [Geobacter sp. AOG1]